MLSPGNENFSELANRLHIIMQSDNSVSPHSFHVPVMGTGFTIDTPLKVARYGISSVISIGDDILIEKMRKYHCDINGIEYEPIPSDEYDCRHRRITAYLNLIDMLVKKHIEELRNSPFAPGSDILRYFQLLPESPPKKDFLDMQRTADPEEKRNRQSLLRRWIVPGNIDVNIMTKVDGDKYHKGKMLPPKYATAMSALWGYAESSLDSSIVLSAGLNRRLFEFIAEFKDFFPDNNGHIKKKIILKVSDYRSAIIQAKLLARHGLWVSEYRIESGLNCGGHAFATKGILMGPILGEFQRNREELVKTLNMACAKALRSRGDMARRMPREIRITVQGGIGTAEEDLFLRKCYDVDSTGWGTPFLLVPEVTNVDAEHLKKLVSATSSDISLSGCSPLGVPFWSLSTSNSEITRRRRIEDGRPGSPCPKGYLRLSTELTKYPICPASRAYQKMKLESLSSSNLPYRKLKYEIETVVSKSCICLDLAGGATLKCGLDKCAQTAVCCGPSIVDFTKVATLDEIIGHIYGRVSILRNGYRPHMLTKELMLYIKHLRQELENTSNGNICRTDKYFRKFKHNLLQGIAYYRDLAEQFDLKQKESFLQDLEKLYQEIETILPAAVSELVIEGAG